MTRPPRSGEAYDLTLSKARRIIRRDNETAAAYFVAATAIATSPRSTFEDLIVCLKRGGSGAVRAAGALYERTGRRKRRGAWITDPKDWLRYLRTRSFIDASGTVS